MYQPVLTPFLLIAQNRLTPSPTSSSALDSRIISPPVKAICSTTLIASFSTLVLTHWSLRGVVQSIIPTATLLVTFVGLLPGANRPRFMPRVSLEEDILPISKRVVALIATVLCVHTVIFGLPTIHVAPIVLLGAAKALSWIFMLRIVSSPLAPRTSRGPC